MDIWAWVDELYNNLEKTGQQRLATLIYQIPNDLHENRTERFEASIDEAIMGARALKHPWLEVYFRHWALRHQLSTYLEGEKALKESIALMEFAHRDDTLACPQSICVTQDLASCYANVDGPGWVAERIAVIDETMARITPKTNCWDCLAREKADALLDDDRTEEALLYLQEQIINIKNTGDEPTVALIHTEIGCLQLLGRFDEALDKLAKLDEKNKEASTHSLIVRHLLRAIIYAKQGHFDKAESLNMPFHTLDPIYYLRWVNLNYIIAMNADRQKNNWQLGAAIQKAIKHFQTVGSHRFVIDMALMQAKLALSRKSKWAATQAIEIISETIPKLRRQDKAEVELNEIKALYENTDFITQNIPASTPDELQVFLETSTDSDPEMHIDFLYELHDKFPENYYVVQVLSSALNACDMVEKANALLEQYFRQSVNTSDDADQAFQLLIYNLNSACNFEKLALLKAEFETRFPLNAILIDCILYHEKENYEDLVNSATKGFALSNNTILVFQRFEKIANIKLKRFDEVVRIQLEILKELTEDDLYGARWDLLTYAAAAKAWDIYLETCKLLDIDLPEPTDPNNLAHESSAGWIWVRFIEQGIESYHLAERTGPTLARIKSVSAPHETQHANDWIVIEPRMLETPPEDEDERAQFIESYDAFHILEPGHTKAIIIDGPRPLTKELDIFYERFDELGWLFWRRSNNDYEVKHPKNEGNIQGLYFFIAVPENLPEIEVFNELKSLTASFTYPLCWLELAKKVNVDVDYHEGLKIQYGL